MGNYGSLKYQISQRINELKSFGQSKHEAKKNEKKRCEKNGEKWNPARVDGIYSYGTADRYRSIGMRFTRWVKEEYPAISRLDQITIEVMGEYLTMHIEQGKSPWTINQYRSGLAKIFGLTGPEISANLPLRHLEDRVKGKGPDGKHFKDINHLDLQTFCMATGLRAHEVCALNTENIFTNPRNGSLLVRVKRGKGGKPRVVHVLKRDVDFVAELRDRAVANGQEKVFVNVPRDAPIHKWRHHYANARYSELLEEGLTPEEAKLGISRDLGHNRIDVVRSYVNSM